jgi:nitroreductase
MLDSKRRSMEDKNQVIEAIRARRSVRQFTGEAVSDEVVNEVLESGSWAPSGKNNQPWQFAVIRDRILKESMASLTHSGSIIREAAVCIAIFLDHSRVYDRTKDIQAVGACIQNMLLTVHSLGLGGVWLGEILKNKDKVKELLNGGKELELMAVVAIGYPAERSTGGERDRLEKNIFLRK